MAVNPIASVAYARAQALPAFRPAPPVVPGTPRYDETREAGGDVERENATASAGANGGTLQAATPAANVSRGSLLDVKI